MHFMKYQEPECWKGVPVAAVKLVFKIIRSKYISFCADEVRYIR